MLVEALGHRFQEWAPEVIQLWVSEVKACHLRRGHIMALAGELVPEREFVEHQTGRKVQKASVWLSGRPSTSEPRGHSRGGTHSNISLRVQSTSAGTVSLLCQERALIDCCLGREPFGEHFCDVTPVSRRSSTNSFPGRNQHPDQRPSFLVRPSWTSRTKATTMNNRRSNRFLEPNNFRHWQASKQQRIRGTVRSWTCRI